jgi:4-hydroxybenzoate polyprenyltransferase
MVAKEITGLRAAALPLWRALPAWLRGLLRTMRPTQWTKNAFLFIPLLFDRQLTNLEALARVTTAFMLFCLLSSAVYVLNDLVDIEKDRQHPKKRNRPLPSGQLPIRVAILAAVALPILSIGAAAALSLPLALVMLAYYSKDIAYSFRLKHMVIIDVMAVASGFVLRTLAGQVVITTTHFSPWLYVIVGAVALLLAVGKRRQELVLLAGNAANHRAAYKDYNLDLLDDMLRMVTTSTILSYTLYTFQAPTNLGGQAMMLTIPFAVYGLFRYLYLVHVKGEGGAPDELLFKDRPLLIAVILFFITVAAVIYLFPRVVSH